MNCFMALELDGSISIVFKDLPPAGTLRNLVVLDDFFGLFGQFQAGLYSSLFRAV